MTTPTRLFSRILSLAIQGKLVGNHADDTVDDLLKEIAANNSVRKKSKSDPISDDQIPFQIPDNWKWVRLGEIAYIASGSTPSKDCFVNEGVPYLKMYNLRNNEIDFDYQPQYIKSETHNGKLKRSIARPGDVIMNIVGPPLGKVAIIPNSLPECNFNQAAVMISSYINKDITNKYIRYFLLEMSEINSINTKGTAGQENISLTQTNNMRFPLPPLSIQSRIVSKLNEIKALVDECEDIENGLEKDCELLRKKVLDLALRGRLTTQLPSDGDAQTLIDQIEAEKTKSSAKNKKYIPPQPVNPDDAPFQIPDNWKWVRLGEICNLNNGVKDNYGNYPLLDAKYLRGKKDKEIINYGVLVKPDQKVILVDGENSGELFDIKECGYMGSTFKLFEYKDKVDINYLKLFILHNKKHLRDNKKGSAIPHLNKVIFFNLLLPLPPLAEQQRIVEKLEELFNEIENLKV